MRLLQSVAFRLTLLYMVLFGASVAMLLFFIHSATIAEMENQVKQVVNIQLADLGRKLMREGPRETTAAINNLLEKDKEKTFIYLLISPKGKIMTGNLDRWPGDGPKAQDWFRFTLGNPVPPGEPAPEVLATSTKFPRGYALLVGQKQDTVAKIRQISLRVLFVSTGLALVLAAVGGAILTRMIQKRLEKVNHACRKVMSGDLAQRVQVLGSGDEFDHLGENFNAMMSRINELIDGIRDISASVAHDLRTPLNRVRNRLEMIQRGGQDPDSLRQEISIAMKEVDTLVATFNAILRISQAEIGAGREQFAPVDLSALVQDMAELYEALAEDKAIGMTSTVAEDIVLQGERHLLTQAFANLLDNAIKYTPPGGDIVIQLRAQDGMAILSVADRGPGIPAEYHAKVTEKFFRLEQSRTTPGNGLGLALVSAAVRLHGGEMTFGDHRPGLVVIIYLPISPEDL